MKDRKKISRRTFIKDSSIAALGGTLLLNTPSQLLASAESDKKSDVILIRNKNVLGDGDIPNPDIVLEMLDEAILSLTHKKNAIDGWKTLIKPSDIVGIKNNVWSPINTTKQVEQALKKRVLDTGVSGGNINVQDRGILNDPIFNKATALINARPMRAHHWSGVGSLLKNYIMFVPDPYNYHEDACSRLGEIWTYPIVKNKTRLNVLVMFTPQFHAVGPHGFSPRYVWKYYGLIVGFDPVAVDTIGVKIFQAKRKEYFGEERPISPEPKHIRVADIKYGIGNSDLNKINLIRIGYNTDSYIY